MAAFEGGRSGSGSRSKDADMRSLGVQAAKIPNQNKVDPKIGSWSDEANIAFPLEAGRFQPSQKPANFGRKDIFHEDRYFGLQMNYGNPYSSGNQCPIDLLKWKENGFIWNNKGWFRKAKYTASEFP
ncbi:hypothetical protein SUGI_0959160 [Cryptomeria japonica]|nr:hypothetical protein SUGI_0959160 [Cryptomeria japonica]